MREHRMSEKEAIARWKFDSPPDSGVRRCVECGIMKIAVPGHTVEVDERGQINHEVVETSRGRNRIADRARYGNDNHREPESPHSSQIMSQSPQRRKRRLRSRSRAQSVAASVVSKHSSRGRSWTRPLRKGSSLELSPTPKKAKKSRSRGRRHSSEQIQ